MQITANLLFIIVSQYSENFVVMYGRFLNSFYSWSFWSQKTLLYSHNFAMVLYQVHHLTSKILNCFQYRAHNKKHSKCTNDCIKTCWMCSDWVFPWLCTVVTTCPVSDSIWNNDSILITCQLILFALPDLTMQASCLYRKEYNFRKFHEILPVKISFSKLSKVSTLYHFTIYCRIK